jgi:hypothetical protein
MTNERPAPPRSVPTLTEVVAWAPEDASRPVDAATEGRSRKPAGDAASAGTPVGVDERRSDDVAMPGAITEERLIQRVLADIDRQVEQILEYRIREALTPALTRLTDALVREARAELSATLRDVVARSVAQEIRRQRAD